MTRIGIVGARVYVNGALRRYDVVIDGGRIVELSRSISLEGVDVILKLERRFVVLPGFVDAHVHCRDFELSHEEDLSTCSEAALAGGVVCVGDMPNTRPKINRVDVLIRRIEDASRRSKVVYRVHFGVPDDLDELNRARELGVRTVKVYPEDFVEHGERHIEALFRRCSELGMTVIIHPEDHDVLMSYEGPRVLERHNEVRDRRAELSAAMRALMYAIKHRAKVHLTHVTIPEVIDLVNSLRHVIDVTTDVTMHHVLLSAERCLEVSEHPCICKVNPPLRDETTRLELLERLVENKVDLVVSDHAPHAPDEKREDDYDRCAPGFPGLEVTSRLLLSLWRSGALSIDQVVRLYSFSPSRLLGLAPRVEVGEMAYLTIVDTRFEHAVDPRVFRSKSKITPFAGTKVLAAPVATIVGGELAYVHDLYESVILKR